MNTATLLNRRAEIAARIASRKAEAADAAEALRLAAELETSLPRAIAEFKSAPVDINFGAYSTDDFHGSGELLGQRIYCECAERLLADLPAIRDHWRKIEKALA